ncbi:MAG TPA: hypothetical protein VHY37_13935 [Tepidisphaeraceae bacterium]|jgi:hypothetical protein|nr:hypothetical protein [Tepidisphaeraceae bacterium]
MTANQTNALDIAARVLRNELIESELDDRQWALALLASSLGHSRLSPRIVCGKIIADFRAAAGFFADITEVELAEWDPALPITPPLPSLPDFPPNFHSAR